MSDIDRPVFRDPSSQLKFEYEVHLLNYTTEVLKKENINWAFKVFKVFFKPWVLKTNSTALASNLCRSCVLYSNYGTAEMLRSCEFIAKLALL